MASPFAVFRKHQRVMLATLTILAMFAFVFLDPRILSSLTGRGGVNNPVIISTARYGKLTKFELDALVRQRMVVRNFLQRVMLEAASTNVQPEMLNWMQMMISRQVDNEIGPATERAVGETWLVTKRAEELGMLVTNKAVNDYLQAITADRLPVTQIRTVLRGLNISEPQLFEAMRQELLARQFRQMFVHSIRAVPPGQRWEYYRQLNRRATVELAALPVEKYIGDVPAPSEAVLKEFFDRSKDKSYDPSSPEAGLKMPHRVNIEYCKADYSKLVDETAVSEEEIRDYYDKHKEEYVKTSLPPMDDMKPKAPKSDAKPAADEKPVTPPPKPTPKTEPAKPAAMPEPAKTESKPAVTPAAPAKPEVKPEAKPEPAKAAPAKSEPAKPADAGAKPQGGEKAAPAEKKSSASQRSSLFRLTAYQPDKKAEEKPAAKTEPAKTEPAKTEPAKTEPAKTEPAKTEPAKTEPAKTEVKEYQPLEKVKNEVRLRVARQKAAAQIGTVLAPVQDQIRQYGIAFDRYRIDVKKNKDLKEPVKPDLAVLAAKVGVKLARTGMVSVWDLQKQDIGQASVVGGNQPVAAVVYDVPGLYRPAPAQDLEGNRYLFWKTEDSPEHVPDFNQPEIHKSVADVWKRMEARALAEKRAAELVAKANAAPKNTLKETLKGDNIAVTEPRPFSWMTQGMAASPYSQSPPKRSDVDGTEMIGDEFMRAVFNLNESQAGVAWNHPKSVAYVVRINLFTPADSVLWDLFSTDDFSKYSAVGQGDWRHMSEAWQQELHTLSGFKWEMEPDQRESGNRAPPPSGGSPFDDMAF